MDPDPAPDPVIFFIGPQDLTKSYYFFCELLIQGTFTLFFQDKMS